MKKTSSAEVPISGVAALEGEARQRGAFAAGETTLSLHSSAATGKPDETALSLNSNTATEIDPSRSYGGPVSRRAGNSGMRSDGQETVPPKDIEASHARPVCRAGFSNPAENEAGFGNPALQRSELGSRSLWLWVGAGFLLMVFAWVALFTVARSAKIETVPRTTQGGRS